MVADGAMGTMLQSAAPTLEDFEGLEGCNEVLNVTRPDIVRGIHDAYFAVGVDAVETNTFGVNLGNLAEYDITDRIHELAYAGARLAREVADSYATVDRPRWVVGSIGPGTRLPTLGHVRFADLRDAYAECSRGLIEGGADLLLVETCQDLLQAKAAVLGARSAMRSLGQRVALGVHVTVETTGTMLLGSEIGAALTALEPLGIDLIGLNCATGPTEMSEHLRHLSRNARVDVSVMPNAGLPVLGPDGPAYPLTPDELAAALAGFVRDYGLRLVGGCCGTTPEHLRRVVEEVSGLAPAPREVHPEAAAASLYSSVPFRQDNSALLVGERTNANGSKAFREAMLEARWEDAVGIGRQAVREGAHMLDVCVDYVGRDGVDDMREMVGRLATASTLPIMLDSTEPRVIEAGLEMLGGRAVINSVNFEDGDGRGSRFATVMPIAAEHGAAVVALCIDEEGQARTTEWKVRVAERLIETLTLTWGLRESDILVDTLTFTLGTGQEESRRDALATIEAIRALKARHPQVQTILGVSNVSFGLSPAARIVLNSVFLDECRSAGLDAAIVHASRILPMARIPFEQREVALDLIYDRRREGYDPLVTFLGLFEGASGTGVDAADRAAELAALPVDERLHRRVVDGEPNGLTDDLDEAMAAGAAPLEIVNGTLLGAMKEVGELFGSGQMQLPFVLQSAEVMKAAVAHLEPHMESTGESGKGLLVLATVKGDVHDIGKNLVDIILSNNGYRVVNLGIKQPVSAILDAAEQYDADAIGMSGLLVKSTVIMKENLLELNQRGLATRFPVLLGGAALTRSYVEQDLHEVYDGEVYYARDAFEGLSLMDGLMEHRRTAGTQGREEQPSSPSTLRGTTLAPQGAVLPISPTQGGAQSPPKSGVQSGAQSQPQSVGGSDRGDRPLTPREAQEERRQRRARTRRILDARRATSERSAAPDDAGTADTADTADTAGRSDVDPHAPVPQPPFLGARVVRGLAVADIAGYLDERALFLGQWGLKPTRGGTGPSYEDLVVSDGRPRLRYWLDRLQAESILAPAVAYGYFPCVSEGDELVVLTAPLSDGGTERARFRFPRQSRDRHLCLADFFRSRVSAEADGTSDVVAFQIATMGQRVSEFANELFAAHAYRDYLEVHGLSVQMTEALAEYWHARVREELVLPDGTRASGEDSPELAGLFRQGYRGSRYSFGYPACPDLEQQTILMDLLDPGRIGVSLSEEFQLVPEQSTSALVVHHPEAKYFAAR